jgi:hypothetical protein
MVKWADETQEQVRFMSATGKSIRDIAVETGKSKSAIHSFLKKSTVSVPELNVGEIQNEMSIDNAMATQFINEIVHTSDTIPAPTAKQTKESIQADSFLESLLITPKEKPEPKAKAKGRRKTNESFFSNDFSNTVVVDTSAEKGLLIANITMNVNNFEPLLKDFIKPNKDSFLAGLYKKSLSELQSLLKTLETTRSVGNLTNQFLHFFYLGSNIVEVGTKQFLNMDTTGLTQALKQQNEEIAMIMKEICMERVDTFKKVQKPEIRLAMILTTTAIGISSQNQMRALQMPRVSKPEAKKPSSEEVRPAVTEAPQNKGQPKKPSGTVLHKTLIPEEEQEKFNDL